jgi:hypothetical protein
MNTTDLTITPPSGQPNKNGDVYGAMIQPIKVSAPLTVEHLFEMGRRGPYYRYVNFPVEVTTLTCPSGCDQETKDG